jgi:hypothetical protein
MSSATIDSQRRKARTCRAGISSVSNAAALSCILGWVLEILMDAVIAGSRRELNGSDAVPVSGETA